MRLLGVKFYEVVDIGRNNNSYYVDREGYPNNVKINYDVDRRLIILRSEKSNELKVVPVTNVVYMQPYDGELERLYGPDTGQTRTAGAVKKGNTGRAKSSSDK